jgi:hypothetical protein
MTKPEKIQELQASIACTLLLPLEKIQIEAIYRVVTGVRTKLPVEPRDLAMSSNGEAGCFLPTRTTNSGTRRLRALQASNEQIQVDYNIVEPPQEIADLSVSDLSTILASSTVMTEMSASVGGTGVEAAPPADAAPAPSSGTSLAPTDTKKGPITLTEMIAFAVGGGGGFVALIAVAVAAHRHLNKKKEPVPVSQPVRVVVLDHKMAATNPMFVAIQTDRFNNVAERRVAAAPQKSRV